MRSVRRILVFQTAFLGDVVLTLPLVQAIADFFAQAAIDIVVVPRSAEVCRNHPNIGTIIEYDKRGRDKGLAGYRRLLERLRERRYDLAFVPHRSIRSASLAFLAGIPLRVGFTRSAGRFLFNKQVHYDRHQHEIERNISLLGGLGIHTLPFLLPTVHPSNDDRRTVERLLAELRGGKSGRTLIAFAPGTIWNTKRWLKERFAQLADMLGREGYRVVLIGGSEDVALCEEIERAASDSHARNLAGKLTVLQSAEVIRRCAVLVTNDSAPMHLGVAVGTPVVAIFGATVPAFGFAPRGPGDVVVETRGLRCRPCSIHGGARCPIKTFDCMERISAERVFLRVMDRLGKDFRGSER
ncbi:MAG: lipopolysaccharide heptosyltransferase II [Ignavibacteria bacterium]|nr:lipopolysaccharide heptosyltransferase II [Ignavibacteria bacterium]